MKTEPSGSTICDYIHISFIIEPTRRDVHVNAKKILLAGY